MITDEFLLNIFNKKPGIFDSGTTLIASNFINEKSRISNIPQSPLIDFDIIKMPIIKLKENIASFKASKPTINYIMVNYGLKLVGASHKFTLVFRGVELDSGKNGRNLRKKINDSNSTSAFFTNENFDLVSNNSFNSLINKFKEVFNSIHGNGKFVVAAFIKIEDFLTKLDLLNPATPQVNNRELAFSLGFMESVDGDPVLPNFKCFHVIFKSDSGLTFSTFDGDQFYSGPKPGSPPLSDGEE